MTPGPAVEFVRDPQGHPVAFLAEPGQLREALAAIPGSVLSEAYSRAWKGNPPRRTARQLRKEILDIHRRRLPMGDRLVGINEAAPYWRMSSRTLRRRVADGEIEPSYLSDGTLALPAPRGPLPWRLIPHRLRPDPRVV